MEYASPPLSALLPAAMAMAPAAAAALLGSYLSHLPNPPSLSPSPPFHNESVCPSVRPVVDPGCPPPSLFPLPSSSHSLPELLIQSDCAQEKNRVRGKEGGWVTLGLCLYDVRIEGSEVGIIWTVTKREGGPKKPQNHADII